MSTRIRSSSMGAIPRPKKHFTTRAGSVAVPTLDVRCACQFFQSESLLPERINPVGSRPSSSQGYHSGLISPDLTQPVPEPENGDPESQEGFSFGLTDYYSGRPTSPVLSRAADTNISKITNQQNLPSSNVEHNGSSPGLQDQEILSEQKGTEVLRQKDPTESVLLRRRSESTQRNLDTAGQQRDPSTSSILRRRLSEKNITNIQQRDPSKSSMLRRRMDSQGSLQQQSSTEEPLAKEPKIKETTPVREPTRPSQPLTNAERFKLSKNTLQMKPSIELSDAERFRPSTNPVQMKPSIELSDLYRETMIFPESESKEQLKPKTIDMDLGKSSIQKSLANGNEDNVEKFEEDVDEAPVNIEDVLNGSQDMLPSMANGKQSPYSPTSSALVHIGQNIYIEEPGQSSEQSSLPAKVERPSRRDYPDKKNKNTDDNHDTSIEIVRDGNKTKMVDEDHGSNENISGTLLPRDLREQSTVSTNSKTIKVDHPIPLKESKRDLSTSSILHRKYIRSQSFDSPTDAAVSTPVTIRQRDPSTSSLLRRRYYQGMEDTIPDKKPSVEEPLPSATELIDNTTINLNSEVLESPSEIVPETTFKNISPIPTSTGRLREKMDWIERTYNTRDHEYEPIGESNDTAPIENASSQKDELPHESKTENQEDNSADAASITSHERKLLGVTNVVDEERDLQLQHIEEEVLAPTPQTDHSRNDEICTSQVDSSAIEDLPLRREDRKKSFMASTSDKTRNVQRKLSKQADRLKSKFKEMQKPKQEDSPKSERKRFRSPEFNKLKNIKMPKISKPELKRPEFTKFKKPDFKFTKPEILKKYDGFSSLRLRKKSTDPAESISDESKITRTTDDSTPTKKRFDFGTYPRIFDRMRRSGTGGTTISRDTEPDEECDRINTSGPILFSTVPRSKKDKNPIRSKWAGGPSYADDESSSGKFKHYSLDRESSIEKRMRLDFKDSIDADDEDGERGILQTEEQKQFADYDKENRAIHQISQAKEGEFRQRKPLIRQESDVVSEESNKELGWVDTDHLRNRLMAQSGDLDISQKEDYVNEGLHEKDHQSTQETQSTGSSSNRRRKGVIEEIDDDEFFLRKKGISQDDIQIGKYISAAIREGLDTPVNALAQLSGGQYEPYYDEDFDISNERVDYGYDVPPRKPRRVRHFEKSLSSEFNDDSGMMPYNNDGDLDEDINVSPDSQFFQTYPPSRPRRKTRKQQSEESHDEHEVPVAAQYYPHPDEDDHSFYENKHMEGIEQPDIKVTYNEDDNLDIDYTPNEGQMPPKAPKRRKHLLRESVERDSLANNFVGRSVSNSYLTNENAEETVVFRTEHEYVPLVQPETFTTPTPTPRSRSKASPFTDDDRTSRGAESLAFDDAKLSTDLKDANGYAVVKKEPPPRPPAPLRRKRSTRSLGDRQFFTMPLRRNQNDLAPERPVRNYSTIGPTRPIRPARRVSLNSIEKPPSITSDATQYEEIDGINHLDKDHKADQNYTMKHRPLPPPPRPPRERKHRKSSESDGNKLDKDGGGEKITSKNVLGDISRISSEDMEEIEEMERSTQTDPLPDDYLCEEFDINSDMPIIEPSFNRHSKTLEDILKEEQQAEMERARQIADENSLTKGIQKFREANQRSLSERSRGSTSDRPKTPSSRPITPSAVIIEKKTNLSTVETDAQLIVQPVDEDEIDATTNITHRNRFFAEDTVDTEDERIVNEALKRYNLLDSDFRDSSPQQDIELNIREVEPPSQTQSNEVPEIPLETPPQAPPRRKSSCAESTVAQISNVNDENVPIPEEDRTDIESHSGTMNLLPGNRLHINELEIEHLNVHDLQAGRILVSDLQAIAISSQDIECTSGDLTVKGITIPASFLEELINRARTTAIDAHSTEHDVPIQLTQEPTLQQMPSVVPVTEPNPIPTNEPEQEPEPPARPPPPRSLYPSDYAQYSLPPPSFYQLRSYPDEIEEVLPHSPTTTHRQRRRFHRRRDSTSEEEEQREHRRSRQHNNRSPEPSIGDLSGQLMRACGSAIGRGGVKLYALMKEKKQEMKRRDISIGVAILIFVVAFLMMIGIRGERTVHHHHWDYWNPPGSSGRP